MWEERTTVWVSSRVNSLNTSRTSSRTMGSSPLVASSSSRSLAPWDRAAAMASFIFMPREKSLNCLVRGMSKRVR